jgi:hypothetical protein
LLKSPSSSKRGLLTLPPRLLLLLRIQVRQGGGCSQDQAPLLSDVARLGELATKFGLIFKEAARLAAEELPLLSRLAEVMAGWCTTVAAVLCKANAALRLR